MNKVCQCANDVPYTPRNHPFNVIRRHEISATYTKHMILALRIWKDILKPGSPYHGRPEFNPATERTMVLEGVGGHVHERGERWGFLDWDFPGLRHAVHVEPPGWTVELALPWPGLRDLADERALPPRHGDVWRIDCSRFQQSDPSGRTLNPSAGWTWNRHGHYDSHIPETFTYVEFSEQSVAGLK